MCLASCAAANAISSLVQSDKYFMFPMSAAYLSFFDGSSAGLLFTSSKSDLLGSDVFLADRRGVLVVWMLLDINAG